MGLLFGKRVSKLTDYGVTRGVNTGRPITRTESLNSSVKWAALRLRADLISTTPLDVYRRVGKVQVELPKPPVLRSPGGPTMEPEEWLYSTQFDLDDAGNTFGLIGARDGAGRPALIELVPLTAVTVRVHKGGLTYLVDGQPLSPDQVWHERQFTVSGSPVGLSPAAHAVMANSAHLGAQQFIADWFNGSGVPVAHMRNTTKTITTEQADELKARMESQLNNGDLLLTGNDWEYTMMGAKASESAYLETMEATASDLCRFYGVPGDVIDVAPSGSAASVTYASISQRNLQLLILNLGPAFTRRENAFSRRLLPEPNFAKFATDALVRMDPAGRYAMHSEGVEGRFLAPSEARALENRPPFTADQLAEFDRLFPNRQPTSVPKGSP